MMNCSPLFCFLQFLSEIHFFAAIQLSKETVTLSNETAISPKKQELCKETESRKMQPPSQKCNHPPKNATAKASCFVALFNFVYFPFIWFKRNGSIFSRFLVCCFPLFYVLLQNKKRNDFVSIVAFRCGCGSRI